MTTVNGIDLNLLVTLGALLEERNLTRAAARLNQSQPTMSVALGRLRRHFDDELLLRDGRRYLLSPLAERLLPTVQEALRQAERTFAETGQFDPGTSTRCFSIAISGHSIMTLTALLARVHYLAPGVRIELRPVPAELVKGDRSLLQHDLLIAPMDYYRPGGQPEVICRDRFACVVDPANPRLRDGRLSLADLAALPHVAALFPHAEGDPVRAALERAGLVPNVVMATIGWLPVPFLVGGTDMVAMVPERLARRVAGPAGVTIADTPLETMELVETAWWHPMRATDPALTWLRSVLTSAAQS